MKKRKVTKQKVASRTAQRAVTKASKAPPKQAFKQVIQTAQDAKKKVEELIWTRRKRKVRTSASFRTLTCGTMLLLSLQVLASVIEAGPVKILGFQDLSARYQLKLNDSTIRVTKDRELIQTIKFTETPVDFDILCMPTHCFMSAVTLDSVELYGWQRTQFDLKSKRYLFSKPEAVRLLSIDDEFYIVIAQEQRKDAAKFSGSSVMKFRHPEKLDYHQFIKLRLQPSQVDYIKSTNIIVFSNSRDAQAFIWSPLDHNFWPHNLPKISETQAEDCFYKLQRILADRDIQARRLLETSKSIWRLNQPNGLNQIINISAQVIVHGNVTVLGSLIESPQISLIAGHSSPFVDPPSNRKVGHLINTHSPAIVENNFKQAIMKLEHMRQKLSRAVLANLPPGSSTIFNDQVRFFGNIEAREVLFKGIENSNVRLNGIPFRQLQHELVSLSGVQDIGTKAIFEGRVVADKLEIHGLINDYYYLKDAIDITSRRLQIIDASGYNQVPRMPSLSTLSFHSISTPELMLVPNATINLIHLDDFITRDNRTQFLLGRKSFKRLSIGKLDLANQDVLINNHNILQLSQNAIHLRNVDGRSHQTIRGHPATFMKGVQAKRVFLNNMINKHINLTSLIHDSVKSDDTGLQQIYGQKNFLNFLQINRLETEGALNGIEVSQVFNLNPGPPLPEHQRSPSVSPVPVDVPITGEYRFKEPVSVQGSLSTGLINGIDVSRQAIRRFSSPSGTYQVVRGHKTFYKPLRVMSSLRLLNSQEALLGTNVSIPYPMVNNVDLRLISVGLNRQKQQPSLINIDDLEIDGNINLPSSLDRSPPRITLGNYSICPLELISKRLVLANNEEQTIEIPIRVNSLRAKSVSIEGDGLNGLKFPSDFVMRLPPSSSNRVITEPVFGMKNLDHLIISPSNVAPRLGSHESHQSQAIVLDRGVIMNMVNYSALQTFVLHERQHNSTGEKVLNTINVYGKLYSSRINGYRWPHDILLKSISSKSGMRSSPYHHKRIYSHLVFLNSSNLHIDGQVVLRGPVQLNGRLNGVNLTDFARHSATYGDKDLYSVGRPIRNKVFLSGITVRGEIRSQGLLDGVNFEDMERRVVTINPGRERSAITSPKVFMSDTTFQSPIGINHLGDLSMDRYLRKVQFEPDGQTLRVFGKKTVTGALRINRNLFVHGLINGVDFTELQARAISLKPSNELKFNKTLTVEGHVFMDNLWIDERNGTIDGVKLKNLLPVGVIGKSEFALQAPRVNRRADPSGRVLSVAGTFLDCQVSCNLQQLMNEQSFISTRTTPPYTYQTSVSSYQPIFRKQFKREAVHPTQQAQIPALMQRTPIAVNYDRREPPPKSPLVPDGTAIVRSRLDNLRDILRVSKSSDIVVGFIVAPTNDVSNYELPEEDPPHPAHTLKSYLQLDQIDFSYPNLAMMYHLSVGVATNQFGRNITSVYSSLGDTSIQLSVLPVEFPNSAKFLKITGLNYLFLLISHDYSISTGMCATSSVIANLLVSMNQPPFEEASSRRAESGIQVYLFVAFSNSSSYTSAYFDLYQTIDLPGIDSFEKFTYHKSAYVLAISRSVGRVYLLLLRGYSGFQIVSYIETPMVEKVTVMFSQDQKPILVVHQTNGMHRLMEPVII